MSLKNTTSLIHLDEKQNVIMKHRALINQALKIVRILMVDLEDVLRNRERIQREIIQTTEGKECNKMLEDISLVNLSKAVRYLSASLQILTQLERQVLATELH